jgi:nucleotide-binding universal stress UspA family protein
MKAVETATKVGLKNILFLTDFSRSSQAAFEAAKCFARKYDAKLIAAHVLEPSEYQFVSQLGTVEMTVEPEESARKKLRQLEENVAEISHASAVERGEVWAAISSLIRKNDADLLVMGTHGRTGLKRLLMGSVAERAFRQAHCPVLTVGPQAAGKMAADYKIRRVLFATDFDAESKAAFVYALSMAQEFQAELAILHVKRLPLEPLDSPALLVLEAEKAMAAMVPEEAKDQRKPALLVRFGDPAAQILKAAKEKGADLIVLGAKSTEMHPAIATHVIMATAHMVVCDAECPVLTVRG